MLTQERLKELLDYDPETGLFTWKKVTSNRTKVGDVCRCISKNKYVVIRIDGDLYYGHRLAWLYTTGSFPEDMIDHFDGDRQNNRFANLRCADAKTNIENRRTSSAMSGMLGVYPSKKRWTTKIAAGGKKTYLGLFKTKEEAHNAYIEAKRKLHKGNTL